MNGQVSGTKSKRHNLSAQNDDDHNEGDVFTWVEHSCLSKTGVNMRCRRVQPGTYGCRMREISDQYAEEEACSPIRIRC